jgi:hypothetical protein
MTDHLENKMTQLRTVTRAAQRTGDRYDNTRGSVVVKALCCKQKVTDLIPYEVNKCFSLPNPSGCTRPWGFLSL